MARDLRKLGRLIRAGRDALGWSALAVSKAAGLSMNYVRNVERGLRCPRPDALISLCHVLELDARSVSQARRWAGIDADPGTDPESRAARREAWPVLAHALANQILLPRGELTPLLEGARRMDRVTVQLLRAAAESTHPATFAASATTARPPPRLLALIEEHFGGVWAGWVRVAAARVTQPGRLRAAPGLAVVADERYAWVPESLAYYELLRHLRTWGADTGPLAYEYLIACGFDRSFAACFFPAVYWHACRCWPFLKVVLPWARFAPDVQRKIYDAVRTGLSLSQLDEVLLGRGPLGQCIASSTPVRPYLDFAEDAGGLQGRFFLLDNAYEETVHFTGPPPPNDAVFDHLDRSEFLARFLLIRLDEEWFTKSARALDLPSWSAWREHVRAHASQDIPSDHPLVTADRFLGVMDLQSPPLPPSDSLTLAQLTQAYRSALESRIVVLDDWGSPTLAGDALHIEPAWLRIVRAFGAVHPAPVGMSTIQPSPLWPSQPDAP
jgi:transcriptional regulator with XRE-family HTH domain